MSTVIDPRMVRQLASAHAVYRMYDRDKNLLYIGKTGHGARRLNEHSEKIWFPIVAMITLEWHASAAVAADAERAAIRAERPQYNVRLLDTPKRKPWKPEPKVHLPAAAVAVADVLSIFNGDDRLHWQTLINRLAERYPNRWADANVKLVAAHMRNLGVPGAHFRVAGSSPRTGCRRADVEAARATLSA